MRCGWPLRWPVVVRTTTGMSLPWVEVPADSMLTVVPLLYREAFLAPDESLPQRVEVPMGHARFPGEGFRFPRAWIERLYPGLCHWTDMPRGGHFAAMEEPELLVEDVRSFFRALR